MKIRILDLDGSLPQQTPLKDRYGTLFEFNPTTATEFSEFDAVRRDKAGAEKAVAFKRVGGGRTTPFAEAADPARHFTLTTADYVTVALEVKEGDAKAHFDADLDDKGRYKSGTNPDASFTTRSGERR